MSQKLTLPCGARRVQIISTDVSDGDFAVGRPEDERDAVRQNLLSAPWTWLKQVHGSDVVEVDSPGQHAGATADGALTTIAGSPIAVTTADCAPVVLTSTRGVAVVHAGWRGALGGVITQAASQLLARGGTPQATWLGPCIGPKSYEFGQPDLERLAERFGPQVASTTTSGAPALDMFEVIKSACIEAGWPAPDPSADTAGSDFFSHRVRGDKGRQTTVAVIYE